MYGLAAVDYAQRLEVRNRPKFLAVIAARPGLSVVEVPQLIGRNKAEPL